jgi:cytochrome c-type biogenesis protein CcmH/NrfF
MRRSTIDLRRAVALPLVTLVAGLALFMAFALGPSQGHAQTVAKPAPKASLTDIEPQVMCVVCGRPLSTSAGTAADAERAVIQSYIDQGLDTSQIKEQLVREYGKQILLDNGDPIAGAAPIIAAVVGVLSVGLLLRRRIGGGRFNGVEGDVPHEPGPEPELADPTDEDDARIEAELAERD